MRTKSTNMFLDKKIIAGIVILCLLLVLTTTSSIFFYYENLNSLNQLKILLDSSNTDVEMLRKDLLAIQDSLLSLKVQSGALITNADQTLLAVNTVNANQGSSSVLIYLATFVFIIGSVYVFYRFSGGDGSDGVKKLLEDFFTIAEITDSSNKSVISALGENSTVQNESFVDLADKLTIIHQQMYVLELKLDLISLSHAASTAAVPLSGL